jgi:hypothetical protein
MLLDGRVLVIAMHVLASFDFPPQRRVRIRLGCSLMEPPARRKISFVSARRSPPLVLIAIRWIRRDMENRRNLARSGTSMESGAGPPTSCSSPGSLNGHLVASIATRGGSRRDGDVAMAIFASYVIGQFMPMFY